MQNEETVTVMVAINGHDDASFDPAFTFHGNLRDIYYQVKQHAMILNSSFNDKYLMDISENEEGLPQVEMHTNSAALNMIVFATRKYETYNVPIVGEMI